VADINNGSYDNCGIASVTLSKTGFDCSNVGPNTVTLTVTDVNGNVATGTATVTVVNVAPEMNTITIPTSPMAVNSTVNASATFTDTNVVSATITWDNGLTPTNVGVSISGNTVTATRTFAESGVYTVTITVTDACGLTASITSTGYIVIYDPSGGFVTGGGWINSPVNAYAADPSLTGRANFGFVSKYLKGANVPTGNTEFQFQVGNLNFKSTVYQWLVVSCSKAQYKGSGTINGSGDYGFLITALDGSPDKFRIKIWDKATSATVYDNQMGSSEDSNAATDIAGGSIVVHDTKCKNSSNARVASPEAEDLTEELTIEAYPNPMGATLSLNLGNPKNEPVMIQMMDVAGRTVITRNSDASADGMYQLDTQDLQSGLYILRVKVGSYVKTMKLLKD